MPPKFYAQKTCRGLPEMNDSYVDGEYSIHEYNRHFSNVYGPTFMFNYAKRGSDCRRKNHRGDFDFYALDEHKKYPEDQCDDSNDEKEIGGTWYNKKLLNKLTSRVYETMNSFTRKK